MLGSTFARALSRSSSTLALLASFALPGAALAQTQAADPQDDTTVVDEIIVTGVRASLDRAMDIKRNSNGVVDAISAEDIGKFPDTNLAESLQRVPGVSINRVNGEGSEVTVRGFGGGFNLVTLNGRQMPTANVVSAGGDQSVDFATATSRSFDFSNIASEAVSLLEVYKTGQAAVPSGGIGATINVVTRRPLDNREAGLNGSFGLKAVADTSVDRGDDVTPEASGLLGWRNEDSTLGVQVFGSYQSRDSAAASSTVNQWNIVRRDAFTNPANGLTNAGTTYTNLPATNQLVAFPNDSRYHFSESERERINTQAVAQWRPMESLTVTADALYAENSTSESRSDVGNWFSRPFDVVRFDDNEQVATAVFLQETIDGGGVKDVGYEQQYRATKDTLESYGLNLEWQATDNLTFVLDAHSSKADSRPDSANGASSTLVGLGANVIATHSVDFTGDLPKVVTVVDDTQFGNGNGLIDSPDVGSSIARTFANRQRQEIQEIRLGGAYDFGGGGRFDFGAEYIDSEMTSTRSQTQQALGNWGIAFPGDVDALAAGLLEQFCLTCKFDEFNPGVTGNDTIGFRGNAVDLLAKLSPAYAADANPFNGAADAGNPVVPGVSSFNTVSEETWAVYGQLTFEGELGSMPIQLVGGIRYENTDVVSSSLIDVPTAIIWQADNDFLQVAGGGTQPVTGEGGYDNVLPSLDFSIEPMEDVKLRASFSRTLARPDFGNLFSATTVTQPARPTALGGQATGTSGNPNLLPLVSDNLDFSAEWYFAPSSYVSVGFFDKRVRNFIGQGLVTRTLFDLRDPTNAAPGSNSGIALGRLQSLGLEINEANLFTYTALLIENGGNTAQTDLEVNAQRGPDGALNPDFIVDTYTRLDVTANANDPLFNFSVEQPVNNREANINGFEFAGQYFFGDTGFGVAGSYTIVNGDVDIDVGADPSIDQFALLGLSDSGNVTLIYDKFGVSARLAYNWRDKYLTQTNRDGSNNRNPVFTAPFGTLDFNVSYDINDNVAVSFEGINLLSETVRTYARTERQLYFAQELAPRYLLGLRARF